MKPTSNSRRIKTVIACSERRSSKWCMWEATHSGRGQEYIIEERGECRTTYIWRCMPSLPKVHDLSLVLY